MTCGREVSIVGGKLTTFRLMAEKTADAVCSKLGVDQPCATATTKIAPAPTQGARGGYPDEGGAILGTHVVSQARQPQVEAW